MDLAWETTALHALTKVPGVEVYLDAPLRAGQRVDAVLHFGGRKTPLVVEVKRHVNAASVWQLVENARQGGVGSIAYLVVAGDSTTDARKTLVEYKVGFVDAAGNAHVELPGLLLHTDAPKRPPAGATSESVPRLAGRAGVVAEALLLEPARSWKIVDLADTAKASAGLTHRVLARLERERLVSAHGTGPQRTRRVTTPGGLLDLWAEEVGHQRVSTTGAFVLARTPDARLRHVARKLDSNDIRHAITGAAAAALLTPLLSAVPITDLWIPSALRIEDVVAAMGAEQVDQGANVRILQTKGDEPLAFARHADGYDTVSVFRLYVDLRRDPRRGREQADNLRGEVIGF